VRLAVERDPNRSRYERRSAVREWATKAHLEAPERTALDLLGPDLARIRLLDLGVGGGRTTVHFAPLVAEYVGVDYSAPLVEACRRRFDGDPSVEFVHADARSIPYPDHSFDLVVFSVNGIDCLDHEGRMAALREVARLCRPGGLFFFSSHNLDAIEEAISLAGRLRALRATRRRARLPLAVVKHLPGAVLTRYSNPAPSELVKRDWVWLSKGWPLWAPCRTYHATPAEVSRQLNSVGFDLETVILPSQTVVPYEACLGRRDDLWLNYLARRRSPAGAAGT